MTIVKCDDDMPNMTTLDGNDETFVLILSNAATSALLFASLFLLVVGNYCVQLLRKKMMMMTIMSE